MKKMGKTYKKRRDPYARELNKKQYRGKHIPDKRRRRLEELQRQEAERVRKDRDS